MAARDLRAMALASESDVQPLGRDFEALARIAGGIAAHTSAMAGPQQMESVHAVLGKVHALGEVARQFLQERLQAGAAILETVTLEQGLLVQLAGLTGSQKKMARETQVLSVLTNIEVARLGEVGTGFEYLARELDGFSQAVAAGTRELAEHCEERRTDIEQVRRALVADLPRMRAELNRMETDLGRALDVAEADLTRILRAPEEFNACVAEIERLIAEVVAAIQVHDITRQQAEHVEQVLEALAAALDGQPESAPELAEPTLALAGLTVQSAQLANVRQAVTAWIEQVVACVAQIQQTSVAGLERIGPEVRACQEELSTQLESIGRLEKDCEPGNLRVQSTLAGLEDLMRLVGEHLERSRQVRDRLRLLSFNSIVEANRLGTRADAILTISENIKRVSEAWSEITDRSGMVMREIQGLVEQARQGAGSFTGEGCLQLVASLGQTGEALEKLRSTAGCAARHALEMRAATEELQAKSVAIEAAGGRLRARFQAVDGVMARVEDARRELEQRMAGAGGRCDPVRVERAFAALYTTELEREILRAALAGTVFLGVRQSLAGNNVELF